MPNIKKQQKIKAKVTYKNPSVKTGNQKSYSTHNEILQRCERIKIKVWNQKDQHAMIMQKSKFDNFDVIDEEMKKNDELSLVELKSKNFVSML